MKHKVKISVSNKPKQGDLITCRSLTIRDRLLRFLVGEKRKVTVLVPGDSVGEIDICEEGGEENAGCSRKVDETVRCTKGAG